MQAFLKGRVKGKVSELMTLPVRGAEMPILSFQVQRLSVCFFRSLCRLHSLWTCYQAFGYVKAYQTLA